MPVQTAIIQRDVFDHHHALHIHDSLDAIGDPQCGFLLHALQFVVVDEALGQYRPVKNFVDALARRQTLLPSVKMQGRCNVISQGLQYREINAVGIPVRADFNGRLHLDILRVHHLHGVKVHAQLSMRMQARRHRANNLLAEQIQGLRLCNQYLIQSAWVQRLPTLAGIQQNELLAVTGQIGQCPGVVINRRAGIGHFDNPGIADPAHIHHQLTQVEQGDGLGR